MEISSEASEASETSVVVEVVRVSSMTMMTVDLHGNFKWNFDSLDHLKWNSLSDVYWHLDSLDPLESFGDWNVLHDGDLDGDFNWERLGDEFNLCCNCWVMNLAVSLGVEMLSMADVSVGVASVSVSMPVAMPVSVAKSMVPAAQVRLWAGSG